MPPASRLEGYRFGSLTVISKAGTRNQRPIWLCLCDCGEYEEIPQYRLPYAEYSLKRRDVAYACFTCRNTRVCATCGAVFVSKDPRVTCSPECHLIHRRIAWRAYHRRKLAVDHGWWKQAHVKAKTRWATQPESYQRHLAINQRAWSKKWTRITSTPENHEAHRAHCRDLYRKKKG